MDGTLLNSRKQLTDRNSDALDRCIWHGVKLILATARPPRSVQALLPGDLLASCDLVYYNGGLCEYGQGVVRHHSLSADLNKSILDYALTDKGAKLSFEVRDRWYTAYEIDYRSLGATAEPERLDVTALECLEPTKILISGAPDHQGIIDRFGSQANVLVSDAGQLVQIMAPQASKEAAVVEICGHYGIPLREVMAFGDDYNDVGLFRLCGHTVAMMNGIEELKRLATEVTSANDDDGVAQILEKRWGSL
ncbi:HAD family hydrolase [Paenibacillus filicis]|uniref:HAD family hydrolase n=1 Tax=Paenibacillus gyeongsangnamensis TaxID=3388067 RepID=A0ABT4QCF4_9BACL|nr:HAD family hydrolase [Paenibacillus filicis]MCZ8514531.1 HAD family hydrolase [Paenibacillus filicis]